jgi:DNA (cytosine-5)-methyltransferase 1
VNDSLTLGSLFDGIGGFPLAGVRQGFTPVWASEIEPFPIEVTKIRFPEMLHVGDITKLKGAELPTVDAVCGGSPCQDLSVAGKRAGLQGERSGLFMEQIRVIKEMRAYDKAAGRTANAVRPRYMCWENVPGAFSSAEGNDFQAVLEETCRIADSTVSVPRPPGGVWKSAGAILGDQFSLAWRVYDAQYWSVPQRRRRIFLVADFAGHTAPKILFKQDSLFGDFTQGEEPGQGAASSFETGTGDPSGNSFPTGTADQQSLTAWDVQSRRIYESDGIWPSLYSGDGGGHGYVSAEKSNQVTIPINLQLATRHNQLGEGTGLGVGENGAPAYTLQEAHSHAVFSTEVQSSDPADIAAFHINQRDEIIDLHGISGALLATQNMQMQTFVSDPVLCLNDQGGSIMNDSHDVTGTLRAQMDGHPPLVLSQEPELFENHGIDSRYTGPHTVSPTISARCGTGGNNLPLVSQPKAFSLDGAESNSMKSPNPFSGCRETELARTIDTTNPDPSKNQGGIAIVQETYCIVGNIIDRQDHNGGNGIGVQTDISYTVTTTDRHAVYRRQEENTEESSYQQTVGALCRGDEKGVGNQYVSQDKCIVERKQLIRRLTPLECERLQGFPDYWTDIPSASDSARYKALGNSVAIPCVEHVLRGIAYFLRKSK